MAQYSKRQILVKLAGIILPVWLTFLLFCLSIFLVFIPSVKQNILTQKKEAIKQLGDSSCSLLNAYHLRVERGEISLSQAQHQAVRQLEKLRYGTEGKDYYWIHDMQPKMIMHPYFRDLEGRDISTVADPAGKEIFQECVKIVREKGAGYVEYMWQWRDTPGKIVPKISYVKGFAPWGWILGTGIYLEDIERDIKRVSGNLSRISFSILFIVLGVSVYTTFQSVRIERKRIKSADRLQKSEDLHRKFIDRAPIGMYAIDLDGRFTYINKKLEQIAGYPKEDWLNKPFHPVVHPDDLPVVIEKIHKRYQGKGDTTPYEIRVFNSAGEIRWIKITSESIFKDEDDPESLVGIQSFVEDVTDRKRVESELRFNEGRLKAILQANPDPMVVYNLSGHPQFLNPAFTHAFGWSLDELEGQTIPFVPDDQKELTRRKIKEIFDHGRPLSFETRRLTKDGRCLDILLSAAVNKNDDGTPIGMVVNLTEITEKKALEFQYRHAQKMESIGTLTGGIAHDFNNILNVILGNSELAIEETPALNPARKNLEKIKTAGLRGAEIVKQLLSFSRKGEPAFEPVKVAEVLDDALEFLRSLIPSNIEIRKRFHAVSECIAADVVQMNQIMMNLCINAVQEMEKEGGRIEIDLDKTRVDQGNSGKYTDLPPGTYVKIRFKDTGPGISPDIVDRIFDPYFTTKDVGKGCGMGLSVVHGIVKNHKGAIFVDSLRGSGTVFTILLPVIKTGPKRIKTLPSAMPQGHERILFIDDEKAIVEMTQKILTRIGYRVEICRDPLTALSLFKRDPRHFDLVITDMTMPGMTGDKLAEKLLEVRPDIPVIISTGHSSLIDEDRARQIGIAEYIMKPVSMVTIAKTVRAVLDRRGG